MSTAVVELRREMQERQALDRRDRGTVISASSVPSISSSVACPLLELLSKSAGGVRVRAVCVNLDRRPDRWESFAHGCPVPDVARFPAIDGRKVRPPRWWTQGGGAWGCMISHIRILEQALADGFDRDGGVVLALEDDALFPPDFAERVERFLDAVPGDWDQIYLGGQHRGLRTRPPQQINAEVIRPFMVNRTQAYAVRGRFILQLYRHLCDWPTHAQHTRHHVDHRMELLHKSGRYHIYAPTHWLIGQAGGKSDISGRTAQDRFWNFHTVSPAPQTGHRRPSARRLARKGPVWVVGLHRSGSSVTAGILHRLGVHLGNRLGGYENRGTGGFEARGLATICEQAYPFPSVEPKADRAVTKRLLRQWLRARMREAGHRGTIAGGKYPHLCFLIDMLLDLAPDSRFINIDRPIDESIRSLTDRSAKAKGWLRASPERCEALQRALDAAKRAGLERIAALAETARAAGKPGPSVLTIHYHDLLANPAPEIDRIIEYLGLAVRPEQRQAAIALVEPVRKHF